MMCTFSCSSHSIKDNSVDDPLKSSKYDLVKIIAHRGFWRADQSSPTANSIASLKSAQEYHLWGSEFDVQMTADSVPIVFHDDDIEGLSIIQTPLSSFDDIRLSNGEKIPTLDQFLSVAAKESELVLVMELKWQRSVQRDYLLVDKCLELLDKYKLLSPNRVVFISFSTDICERIAELLPEFTVQALFSNKSLQEVVTMGLKGIDYYQDIFLSEPSIIEEAHKFNLGVNVWTVNDLDIVDTLISYGIDYITTDDPLGLRLHMIELSK